MKKYPNIPKRIVDKYKKAGHWPPPNGITIVPIFEPSKKYIDGLINNLALSLPLEEKNLLIGNQEFPDRGDC